MVKVSRIVIADASVLVNFLHLDRLDLLERLPGFEFHVSEHAAAEVTRPVQAATLEESIDAGRLRLAAMTDTVEISRYAELRRALGDGEAASLAIAETRGWLIACDEKRRFRREAEGRLGPARILNTVSLIVLAIREGLIAVAEADAFKERLAERRFRINVASFNDLLPKKR